MKKYVLFVCLFVFGSSVSAQITGVVKDSVSGAVIPYVSICVQGENFATTSEENGTYTIDRSEKSKNLIFSALGYQCKIVPLSKSANVILKPAALELDEVLIVKRYESRRKEIGRPANQISEAFENAPRIDIKFFPYLPEYKKTKWLKQVCIVTDSKIDDASFKIQFYSVGEGGAPAEELLDKEFIVSVDKGVKNTKFNLSKFNLKMPERGIFVGFEKLMIAKNRIERTTTDPATKMEQTQISYGPFLLYYKVERDIQFLFKDGKWLAKTGRDQDIPSDKIKIYEPSITLVLTN